MSDEPEPEPDYVLPGSAPFRFIRDPDGDPATRGARRVPGKCAGPASLFLDHSRPRHRRTCRHDSPWNRLAPDRFRLRPHRCHPGKCRRPPFARSRSGIDIRLVATDPVPDPFHAIVAVPIASVASVPRRRCVPGPVGGFSGTWSVGTGIWGWIAVDVAVDVVEAITSMAPELHAPVEGSWHRGCVPRLAGETMAGNLSAGMVSIPDGWCSGPSSCPGDPGATGTRARALRSRGRRYLHRRQYPRDGAREHPVLVHAASIGCRFHQGCVHSEMSPGARGDPVPGLNTGGGPDREYLLHSRWNWVEEEQMSCPEAQ